MIFEWDEAKAEWNQQKHGVSFFEAESVFDDSLSELFPDVAHSDEEERFIIIGESDAGRLLIVSFTERPNATRIISARLTTKREVRKYETRSSHI